MKPNQLYQNDPCQSGLSRTQEAVISSHFMHKISQDVRLHLYDGTVFESRRLTIDQATLKGRLLPILKESSAAYCQQRVEVARRRAIANFRDFGYGSAKDVGASEFMTEALLDKEFSRNGARYNDKCRLNHSLKSRMQRGRPINMVIPALPFKISSPLKARGEFPDLGEVGFLLSLFEISKTLEILYRTEARQFPLPLVRFSVATDGYRFHEAVNKSPGDISRYTQALAAWIDLLGLEDYIKIIEYKSLLHGGLAKEALHRKRMLFEAARTDYSRVLWPIFDPMNVEAALRAAAEVELDPEQENPEGRFVSLFKSLIYTLEYRTLNELSWCSAAGRVSLYRELTANIFQPYADDVVDVRPFGPEAVDEDPRQLSHHFKEQLRQKMLREAWQAGIDYISEIRSDRDLEQDPVLACLPE